MDVRSLREENELLRERVLQLEAMLAPPPVRLPGFRPFEMRLITAIARREHGLSWDALFDVLYGDRPESELPQLQILKVRMTTARKKLAHRHPDVRVTTVRGWGYRMDADCRRAWFALVERPS